MSQPNKAVCSKCGWQGSYKEVGECFCVTVEGVTVLVCPKCKDNPALLYAACAEEGCWNKALTVRNARNGAGLEVVCEEHGDEYPHFN